MRLVTITLWILMGAALTGGVYWSFLITPESTIWSLAASALLLLAAGFLLALTVSGALLGWQRGVSSSLIRAAAAGVPASIPAALIAGLIWWLAGAATDRVTINSGPINAWFIAALGWDDVSWLFTGLAWLAMWLKWVVAPMLALALMAAILTGGWREMAGAAWLKRALAPLPLATATLLFVALVAAPWIYLAPWRPAGLPATSVELAFVIGKLAVTAWLMAVGVALIIRQATWTISTHSSAN
ncbi:MAG: hypothetical protein Q8T13_17845 [Acidobacteriota bacterium]|nr:hypothetical protein [Acidobacteriota bacterium]